MTTRRIRNALLAAFLSALLLTPAWADDAHFSVLLRLQPELVHVDGSAPERRDREGWYLTDGWGGGNKNSHNFGALFIDGGFGIGKRTRAIARLGFNVDMQGLKDGDAREREVQAGLQGPWGSLLLGRLETPYKQAALGWDPLNGTFLQARANTGRSGGAFGHGGYLNNALRYAHQIGDLRFQLFAAIDDLSDLGSGSTSGNHAWGFSMNVPAGPVELMLAHVDGSEFKQGPDKRTGTKFGLRWNEGPVTLAAHYEIRGRGLEDGDFLFMSGSYQLDDQWTLTANFGRFFDDRDADDGDYAALAARYSIDQRLSVHGGFRRLSRDLSGNENIAGVGMRMVFNTGNVLAR
jgi:predicted porin